MFGHLNPVMRQDRGAHAFAHPHVLHDPRQLVGAMVHLGPVAATVGVDIGSIVRKLFGTAPDEIAKEHRLSLNSGRSRHVVAIGPVCPIAATLAGLGSRSFARHCNFQWPKALRMRPCGDNAFSYGIVGDSLLAKIQRTGRWCGP